MRLFALILLVAGVAFLPIAHSADQESGDDFTMSAIPADRFSLGVAAGLMRFNSNYTLRLDNGLPITVTGEGTLGLEEVVLTPIVYGEWRINPKHAIGFHYFGVDRKGTEFTVNGQFGPLFVDGSLQARDETSFYYLNYSYSFINDDDRFLRGMIGVYALDLNLSVQAFGEVRLDDEPIASGSVVDDLSFFVPLPMIGVQYANSWSEKWEVATRLLFVGGEVNDIRGLVVDANISARYAVTRNVGLIFGLSYFDADVDILDGERQDISYGYDGLFAGLDFNF